jgi:hypothetical protein
VKPAGVVYGVLRELGGKIKRYSLTAAKVKLKCDTPREILKNSSEVS